MKKLNLLLSSLLLILSFTVEAKSPPPGTGKSDVPANILIMLDVSGSMTRSTNSNTRLYYPTDVAVDSQGNIFVVETYYHRIKKYDSNGNLLKTIGNYGRGNGQFRYPGKIDIDSNGNIYITDIWNSRVQKFNNNGEWKTNFNSVSGTTNAAPGKILSPTSVTVDSNGNVYVSGRYYSNFARIERLNASGSWQRPRPRNDIRSHYFLSAHNGSIYAVESGPVGSHSKIYKYSSSGALIDSWNVNDVNNSTYVGDVEVTSKGIYIANFRHYVQKYTSGGSYLSRWGGYGTGDSNFRYINGIGSDSSGNIYVADQYNHCIKKFDSTGLSLS